MAVFVLAAGAFAVFLEQRPPPVSPVVAATFELSTTEGNQYVVQLATPGEEILPIGVVGPSLIDPQSTVPRVTAEGPGLGTLEATVNCADDAWWDAGPDDYAIRVTRTDPYGRTTTNDVPFSRSTEWWRNVRLKCLTDYVAQMGSVGADARSVATGEGREVDLTIGLANPGDHDLRVGTEEGVVGVVGDHLESGGVGWPAVPLQDWPAHRQTSLVVPLAISCDTGETPQLPQVGSATDSQAVMVSVTTASDTGGDGRILIAVPLKESSAVEVNGVLSAAC